MAGERYRLGVEVPWRPVPAEPVTRVHDLRASDADRERVAQVLSEALADGRLTIEEHAERTSLVYSARTLGELTGLTGDLTPAEAQPILVDDRPLQATFGSLRREGRWVMPVRLPLLALFGTVELDLREAILQRRHVVLDSLVLCGRIRLLVPDGVRVDVTGRSILSTREVRVRPADDGPTVEISGRMVLGSVRARAPRRTLRERMRGRLRKEP
ncbi:Cell wall-active antibiotics response 4TMS YvqF [Thermomonospora echinospora]|uniref:Cell wall-active antibiotics response 4TMS YvqF n=1 Tax=Thermomonospora echinospora TaxID=1992 RepID=A0A1H6A9W1_9ACTN|nr:Cell wall-active antibiotics response 4TMS YvqF [Thermomonospora echinospora]